MSIRIIDHKKIDMTDDEWTMYLKIVESYTKVPYQKGEDFFIDLFETDSNGIIIFLKPPSQRQVSLEIFLFVMSVMVHQHLRQGASQILELKKELQDKINEASSLINELKQKNL